MFRIVVIIYLRIGRHIVKIRSLRIIKYNCFCIERLLKEVYELKDLLSELEDQGGYFREFIATIGIQTGIIRLHPGGNDTQEPHSVDEVYYVIEGKGFIKLNGKNQAIKDGTSVLFVQELSTDSLEIFKTS
jgi:Cupin domain